MGVDLSHRGYEWGVGVAYIACPKDIDREDYLKDCYLNHRVSMKTEDGGYYNRVPVSIDVLQYLEFPYYEDQLGSAVVYVTESQHKQPIVIARLPKIEELGDVTEGVLRLGKRDGRNHTEIRQSAKDGFVYIDVMSGEKQGVIKINVDNDQDDCLFGVEVSGDIVVEATQSTYIHNEQKFTSIVTPEDESDEGLSIIRQERGRTLIGGGQVILNGEDIEIIHYKGYKINISERGIVIDALDQDIAINSKESSIKIEDGNIDIEGQQVRINGSYEALYNKTPGLPITDVSQIGISKTVKIS